MIETKEQYSEAWEYYRVNLHFPTLDLIETIEALRELARTVSGYDYHEDEGGSGWAAIQGALAALPDWLLEDE